MDNNEMEYFENWKQKEKIILVILTSYSFGMMIVSLILSWPMYIPPIICAGVLSAWIMCLFKYKDFRFRANVLTFISLLDFTMYAVRAGSLYDFLTPMAAVATILGIAALPEVLRWVNIDTAFLCCYHIFYLKTVPFSTDLEKCRACLVLISIIIVELVVYILMINQKKMLKQMQRIIDELREAENSKSNFLANVSHEIRTPIHAINGISEILQMEDLSPEIKEEVQDVQVAGRNLQRIVNDILDFTELQSGEVHLVSEPYNITSTINDVMNMTTAQMEDKNIDLIVDFDPEIPRKLVGDEQKIRRVIMNLMSNAVKFTEEGTIRLTITYRKEEYGINLIVSVKDTGIGIKEENLEKIFMNFNQVDTRRNRQKNGVGLGLAISRLLVQAMGGFIKVESEWKKGTKVQMVIPQKVLESEKTISAENTKEKKIINYTKMERERRIIESKNPVRFMAPEAAILVVDDNLMNLKVIEGLLRPYQIQVFTAESGQDALQKLEKTRYNFIFMDHMMPEMDGVETLHRIREKVGDYFQTVPIIALTANAVGGAREMFLQEGFQDFVSKPIELPVLERVLEKYIPESKKLKNTHISQAEEKRNLLSWKSKQININLGIQYSGGSIEDYKEIVKVYCTSGKQKIIEIQRYYETKDWKNYTILVHALKSNSLSIGAEELSNQAKDLESAGREEKVEYIQEHHEQMMDNYRQVLKELETKILQQIPEPEEEKKGNLEISKEELRIQIQQLKEEINNFEIETIKPLLDTLEQYQYNGSELSEMIRSIRERIEVFDFMGAQEEVEQFEEEQSGMREIE